MAGQTTMFVYNVQSNYNIVATGRHRVQAPRRQVRIGVRLARASGCRRERQWPMPWDGMLANSLRAVSDSPSFFIDQ
jgi:hypothetical protein